jgi:hypothetical protein
MVALSSLWLPILLSALVVFVASALVWMALPHHRSDFRSLPDEEAVRQVLLGQHLAPGMYSLPHASTSAAMKEPEYQKKLVEGPVGFVTMRRAGPWTMGPQLVQSFLYYLFVSLLVGYIVSRSMPANSDYLAVFRIAGTVGWMAYGVAVVPDSIWFARPWSHTVKLLGDALLYGLLTAGVFGWLWPT